MGNSWWVHNTHTTLQSGAGHIGGGGGGAPFDEREEEIGTIDGEEEPRNTKEEEEDQGAKGDGERGESERVSG